MTRQEAVELLVALGPVILSGIGAILSTVLTVGAALARLAWKAHEVRMAKLSGAILELAGDEKKLWEVVNTMRTEMAVHNRALEHVRTGLVKAEGAMEAHQRSMLVHGEKLGRVESKLEAVFRFIDAPARATDRA